MYITWSNECAQMRLNMQQLLHLCIRDANARACLVTPGCAHVQIAVPSPIPRDARAYKPLCQAKPPGTRARTNRCAKPNPLGRACVQIPVPSPIHRIARAYQPLRQAQSPPDAPPHKPLRQAQPPGTRARKNRCAKPNPPGRGRVQTAAPSSPEDGQPGEGQRLNSDVPHNGERHSPRGRPPATPTAPNDGSQERTLRDSCWVPTPTPTAPRIHGSRNPGCPPQKTGGRGRNSA